MIPPKHPAATRWAAEHIEDACDEIDFPADGVAPNWPMITALCALAIAKTQQGFEGDGEPPRGLRSRY